jgi:hypothetical protein
MRWIKRGSRHRAYADLEPNLASSMKYICLEVTRHMLAVEQRLGRTPRANDGIGGTS